MGKRNILTLCIIPLPRWHSLRPREIIFACDFSCGGKRDCVSEHPAYLAVWDTAKEAHFSHHIQSTELWASWLGGRKRLEEWQIGLLMGIEGTWILLTVADSIKEPAHELMEKSCQQIPQSVYVHSHCCVYLILIHPHQWQLPVHAFARGSERDFGKWPVSMCRKLDLNLQARGKPQTWGLVLPLKKQKGGYYHQFG